MNRRITIGGTVSVFAVLAVAGPAPAVPNVLRVCTRDQIENLNKQIAGRLLDFTANHRRDNRVWCPSLAQMRDLYVYLPPGYDGATPFPLVIWLHGFGQDEKSFLDGVPILDAAIRCGTFPPCVICSVDGTIRGRPALSNQGSFYMNAKAGRFEDYVAHDVYEFLHRTFCLRPERGANVLAGGSMGGYAAYHIGFKHRHRFGVLAGFVPALDIRYADCHDRYFADYDPNCVMERDHYRPNRVIGRFYGVILVKERRVVVPILGRRPADGLKPLAERNPVELLEALDIRPGEFEMFVAYSKRDEFNLDAGTEHFLAVAARRGVYPFVVVIPDGHHDTASARRAFPAYSRWLSGVLAPYVPPAYSPSAAAGGASTRLLTGRPGLLGWLRRPKQPPVEGNPFAPASPFAAVGGTLP